MNELDHKEMYDETSKEDDNHFELNGKILSYETDDEILSEMSDGISGMDIDDKESVSELENIKGNMLDCISESDGFFKSQQVGESDLTFSEKRAIAGDLLTRNISMFLQRYWKYIKINHIPYFEAHRSNYDVDFYVTEIIKLNNSKTKKVRIKNRRYEALKKMVDEGTYFSDSEMKRRNPFLFDQMIGQHLTETERIAAYKEEHPDEKFSSFLMDQIEKSKQNCLFNEQKNEDEAIVEELDDDTSEEESELEDDVPVRKIISVEEKTQLRSEFTNIMYESFLDGKDKEFDYSSVDNNIEYDSVHQRDIDEQEKYFDDDESSHSAD